MKSSTSSTTPNPLVLTPGEQRQQEQIREQGRIIAQGIEAHKAQVQKNMIKAEKRHTTMLRNAAEKALSGKN